MPRNSDDVPAHPGRKLTEQEFVDWCTPKTWAEWVDGEVIIISPVNTRHGKLFYFLFRLFGDFVEEHELGELYAEPVQIRFARLRRRRAPDFFFVSAARLKTIKEQHIEGGPDLIVEIVSPDSQSRDRREKYLEYESMGVREYWIVDPINETVEAYALGRNRKFTLIEEEQAVIHSIVLPRFYLKPEWLWQSRRPKVSRLLREMARTR